MIYFIQSGEDGAIKIGYSENEGSIGRRLSSLQTGNPKQLYLRGILRGNREVELGIHKMFKKYNVRGEWFKPEKEIITFMKEQNISLDQFIIKNNIVDLEEDTETAPYYGYIPIRGLMKYLGMNFKEICSLINSYDGEKKKPKIPFIEKDGRYWFNLEEIDLWLNNFRIGVPTHENHQKAI